MQSSLQLPKCGVSGQRCLQRASSPRMALLQHTHVRRIGSPPRSLPNNEDAELSQMRADIERLQAKSGRAAPSAPQAPRQEEAKQESGAFGGVKETLDKILIADFFLVLFILAWLAAGVAQNAASGSSPLLDAWYPLWPTLWQPALGVLMAGALVSGGIGWLNGKSKEQAERP